MNSDINQYLRSVEISYRFAKDTQHGVLNNDEDWILFQPTRFIYAFFAFNMLYEIDWEKSANARARMLIWHERGRRAKSNFESFVQFISDRKPNAFVEALEKFDQERRLYKDTLSLNLDRNTGSPSYRDKTETVADAFLRAAKKYDDRENLDVFDHFDMLQFCYAVRNNIFHGEKKAHEMKEKGQLKRFVHYGNILLASIEAFYDVMGMKYKYSRVENWEVMDNY